MLRAHVRQRRAFDLEDWTVPDYRFGENLEHFFWCFVEFMMQAWLLLQTYSTDIMGVIEPLRKVTIEAAIAIDRSPWADSIYIQP